MDYIIIKDNERFNNRFYPNRENAMLDITESGTFYICGVEGVNGKLKIVNSEEIKK